MASQQADDSPDSASSYAHWKNVWQSNPGWHLNGVHPELEQFFHELLITDGPKKSKKIKKSLRIFVPLCGKTFDMLWLAKQGHEVVGVEYVQKPIEGFFKENSLSFTTEDVDITPDKSKASVYRCTKEGINITILHSSIYSATEEALGGKFHAVWDRGSLVAIDPEDRFKYVALLKSLLLPEGRSLFADAVRYDQSTFQGPPFSVSEEQLLALFQDSFFIRELAVERDDSEPGNQNGRYCYLLTMK